MIKLKNNLNIILYSLVFIFPSFQLISFGGKGLPNSFLIFSIFLLVLLKKQLKKINVLVLIFAFLVYSSIIVSNNFSLFNLVFAFFPFLIILCNQIKPLNLKNYGLLIIAATFLNLTFCIIQTLGFDIRPSNINLGYSFQEAAVSAINNYFPFSLGRLPGMFNENAPMVLHLLFYIIESLRIKKYLPSLKGLLVSSIIVNLLIIIFTGSKIIISLPFLILFYLLRKPNYRGFKYFSKDFFINSILVFLIIAAYPIIINYVFNSLDFSNVVISGLKSRFQIPDNIPLFLGEGLQASTDSINNQIQSLNGIIIYSHAWGIIPASLILTIFFIIIFSKSSYLHLLILFLSIISSGSLLFPIYLEILLGIRVRPNLEKT
tara:strand:+ start:10148 stop:11272 length:1125 start_codon:yes stop_codon:yes gene_type:complete